MKSVNYRKIAPPDTFIGRYMKHNEGTETAWAYDFHCALWLMSLAIGRECVVARPRAPVFLNYYCILVAESGITRKSSAVRSASKIARKLIALRKTEKGIPYTTFVEARTTPEQLEKLLADGANYTGKSQAAICVSELVTMLGRERYSLAMPGLLTDLYDCPEERGAGGTVSGGSYTLRNVYVSFLSASTPSWLVRAVNPDVVEGGFTSRALFIVEEQPKRDIAWPESDAQHPPNFVEMLQSIGHTAGERKEIGINDAALKVFTRWYKTRARDHDPYRSSFQSREDAHVLRIAGLLAANRGTWQIQVPELKAAISVVSEAKERGSKIFAGGGHRSKLLVGLEKLREAFIEAGEEVTSKTKLAVKTRAYLSASDLATALAVMHELNMVQRFDGMKNGPGRPGEFWRGTALLLGPKAMSEIVASLEG
jgi:hypothetical protein